MQATSDLHKSIFSIFPVCDMQYKAEIDGVEYSSDDIENISVPVELYPISGAAVGRCVCKEIDLSIRLKSGVVIPRAAEIKIYVRLVRKDKNNNVVEAAEWIPKGVLYIDTRKEDAFGEILNVHGFDALYKANKPYSLDGYTGEWPRPMKDVVGEISGLLGVKIDSRTIIDPSYMMEHPNDLTMSEVLGYVGAAHAANWVMTDAGELRMISIVPGDPVMDVGQEMIDWSSSPAFSPYSRVIIWYDDENSFTSGDDTGRTLEIDCPWATQDMADNILYVIYGYKYQPYEAIEAALDPAVELGDGISANGLTSVIGTYDLQFNSLQMSTISAPGNREEDHELGDYEGPTTRSLQRKVNLGTSYYGTKITRKNGLVIEKTDGEKVSAKAVFNADELSFYDINGNRVLYFDPESGTYKFTGYLSIQGLEDGESVLSGSWIKTGTILADLITAGVLQSADGETFVLDLDNGSFKMKGSGRFQSSDGKTYIEIEGDEMVMYAWDENSKTYLDKIHFGFITGSDPNDSEGTLDYPYLLLGKSGGTVGMIKEFYNGLWVGNSVPKYASGNFNGINGAAGFFINTRDGGAYVVNGTTMQLVCAGAEGEMVLNTTAIEHDGDRLYDRMPVCLTQAQYDAMIAAGTYNEDTPYLIKKEV